MSGALLSAFIFLQVVSAFQWQMPSAAVWRPHSTDAWSHKHSQVLMTARDKPLDADVVVIGSGIGGLCAAALAGHYGYKVAVCESHTIAGGCAHSFDRQGYHFDSGPSLWAGMSQCSTNPLRQVLDVVGESNSVQWANYDGWGMHTPDGYFRFTVGPADFEATLLKFGGEADLAAWRALCRRMQPLLRASTAIPAVVLRGDQGVALTALPYIVSALRAAGPDVQKLQGPFTDVMEGIVAKGTFLYRWLDYLSFALSGLPADGTMAAAVVYTLGDLHRPEAYLDYPKGGSGAVIDALVRGVQKSGGEVLLKAHVKEILVEEGRAVGVILKDGRVVRAGKAVISNASIWDTMKLLPPGTIPEEYRATSMATPDTASFMHLHLGIDATGLGDLDIHHSIINDHAGPIDSPQNLVIVSIPTVLDPSLAPPGKHLVHAYYGGNEPYSLWEGLDRKSQEYKDLKRERSEIMWQSLERIIPDIRQRVEVELVASPLTHERYVRRHRGSYGPGFKAGEQVFPGPKMPVKGLLHCGDSTLPGLGVPAVAASGMSAANTLVPLWDHWKLISAMKSKGYMADLFQDVWTSV